MPRKHKWNIRKDIAIVSLHDGDPYPKQEEIKTKGLKNIG